MEKESLRDYVKRFTDWGWSINQEGYFYMSAGGGPNLPGYFIKLEEEREEIPSRPTLNLPVDKPALESDLVSINPEVCLSGTLKDTVILLAEGLTNWEIAVKKGISSNSVKHQVSHLLRLKGINGTGKNARRRLIDLMVESGELILK